MIERRCPHISASKRLRAAPSSHPNVNSSTENRPKAEGAVTDHNIGEVVCSLTFPTPRWMPCQTAPCQKMLSKKPREGKKKVLVALKPTSEGSFFVSLRVESEKHEEICTSTSHFTASKIEMGHLVSSEFTKQQESQEHLMLNLCAIHCE